MNTNIVTFSVTDLRHKTAEVLDAAKRDDIVHVLSHSKLKAAVVSADYLHALQQTQEDYLDVLDFDETISQKRVLLDQYKKRRLKRA